MKNPFIIGLLLSLFLAMGISIGSNFEKESTITTKFDGIQLGVEGDKVKVYLYTEDEFYYSELNYFSVEGSTKIFIGDNIKKLPL